MNTCKSLFAIGCLSTLSAMSLIAQEPARTVDPPPAAKVSVRATQPTDPTYIPAASRVYIGNMIELPGFRNSVVAAFQKRNVNLLIVKDRSLADFEIKGFAQPVKAWDRTILGRDSREIGSDFPESEASIQLVNMRTGVVAYKAAYRVNSWNGIRSTAVLLAKDLRQKMERDDRRPTK